MLAVIVGAPIFRFECPSRDGIEAADVTLQRPEEIGGDIADQYDKQGQDRPSAASWEALPGGQAPHLAHLSTAAGIPGGAAWPARPPFGSTGRPAAVGDPSGGAAGTVGPGAGGAPMTAG